ncbi:MAG: tyrosine-type recombinase/integrase [Lachnospiraceae bacterium]|nr:tyrosine-type recombinase/integrase [Lachnospiraceae bacterium]
MAGRRLKVKQDVDFTLKELTEEFLDEKKAGGRSEKTLTSYSDSFKKFFDYFGEDKTTKDLNKGMIIQYQKHLEKTEELSLASINHYLRDLRTFVNWCYENNRLPEKVPVKLVKGQEEIVETYTDEELERLLEKPDRKASFVEWRTWAIVNWILGTGNRIETIVNIKIGDVHFGQDEILIRAQKNKKATAIPLAKSLKAALLLYIKKCRSTAGDNDWLFCNIEGEQLTTNALQSSLYDYNRSREVLRTSAHALRHTFAKLFITNGGDVFRLQKILGHSTLEMTRHYVNLFDADLKKGYDDLVPLKNFSKGSGGKQHKVKVEKDN